MWGSSGDAKGLGSTEAAAQGISGMWYNGELGLFPTSSYGKDNPDMSGFESWGHFTQMVWAGSSKVGCHSQYCPAGTMYQSMGSWFTVCNYHPAGKFNRIFFSFKKQLSLLPRLGAHRCDVETRKLCVN